MESQLSLISVTRDIPVPPRASVHCCWGVPGQIPPAEALWWRVQCLQYTSVLLKPQSCGLSSKLLDWVETFLAGWQQQETVTSLRLDWAGVTSSVPQGTKLGLLLSTLWMTCLKFHPLSKCSQMEMTRKFSDSRTLNTHLLPADLDTLLQWSEIQNSGSFLSTVISASAWN